VGFVQGVPELTSGVCFSRNFHRCYCWKCIRCRVLRGCGSGKNTAGLLQTRNSTCDNPTGMEMQELPVEEW